MGCGPSGGEGRPFHLVAPGNSWKIMQLITCRLPRYIAMFTLDITRNEFTRGFYGSRSYFSVSILPSLRGGKMDFGGFQLKDLFESPSAPFQAIRDNVCVYVCIKKGERYFPPSIRYFPPSFG